MTTTNKTFSVKNGLDVANTVVLDSNRNISNVASINANTVFSRSGGLIVTGKTVALWRGKTVALWRVETITLIAFCVLF